MVNREVCYCARRFAFLTALILVSGIFQSCGLTRSEKDGLAVHLQPPEGEDPSLFWFGVSQKSLKVTPDGEDSVNLAWQDGSKLEVDLREGDKIDFFGSDDRGRVLVTGETSVSQEKKATIPLHRVL